MDKDFFIGSFADHVGPSHGPQWYADHSLKTTALISLLSEPLQQTHLQRPLLKMSPKDGDETSRGRNPEHGRRRDFGRRRHRQSGFQHTDRPRPSSPELLNTGHTAGRESLSHLTALILIKLRLPYLNKRYGHTAHTFSR